MSATSLDQLMQQAVADKSEEPAFFRALLDATVYAHTPRRMSGARLCLIQFPLPGSGVMVLPFFSDETQARSAAGSTATVVVLTGRELFELTRGATLMLNPNGTSCTLYPEEIAALLDHGEVAIVEQVEVTEPKPMEFRESDPVPTWLVEPLIMLYSKLSGVAAAYLVEVRMPDAPAQVGFLIAIEVPTAETEHVVRATITQIQPLCLGREVAVDLTAFESGGQPDWVRDIGLPPFYVRALGKRLVAAPERLQ